MTNNCKKIVLLKFMRDLQTNAQNNIFFLYLKFVFVLED